MNHKTSEPSIFDLIRRNSHDAHNPWTDAELIALSKEMIVWMQKPENLLYDDFLTQKGFEDGDLRKYATRCPEFAKNMRIAKRMQKNKIASLSMKGKLNPVISKFMLAAVHKLSDRTDIRIYGKKGEPPVALSLEEAEAAMRAFDDRVRDSAKADPHESETYDEDEDFDPEEK